MDSELSAVVPDGEVVVWTGQPRLRSALGVGVPAAVVALLAQIGGFLATPALLGDATTEALAVVWVPVGLVVLGAVAVTGWTVARIRATQYVLTDRRVHVKRGVLGTSVTSLGLERIQNSTLDKGVLGNAFDYGTVSLSTAGSSGAAVSLRNLSNPEQFRRELVAAMEARDDEAVRAGGRLDPATVERLLREARGLRTVAERLEATL